MLDVLLTLFQSRYPPAIVVINYYIKSQRYRDIDRYNIDHAVPFRYPSNYVRSEDTIVTDNEFSLVTLSEPIRVEVSFPLKSHSKVKFHKVKRRSYLEMFIFLLFHMKPWLSHCSLIDGRFDHSNSYYCALSFNRYLLMVRVSSDGDGGTGDF